MRINKIGFLSLFAFIGILGLITETKELLGFFGFAVYLRYFFVTPDEMFIENVRKAASIGFFTGIVATTIGIAVHILLPTLISSHVALALCYIVSIFCFSVVLVLLELKEMRVN